MFPPERDDNITLALPRRAAESILMCWTSLLFSVTHESITGFCPCSADSSTSPYPLYQHHHGATPVLLHLHGLVAVWQSLLLCDSRARRYDTICRGAWGEKWRNSSTSPSSVCVRQTLDSAFATPISIRCSSEVSMLNRLLPVLPWRPYGKAWWLFTATCLSSGDTTGIHGRAPVQRVKESSEMRTFLLNSNGVFIHYGGLQWPPGSYPL